MYSDSYFMLMAEYNQWMNHSLYAACAFLSDEQRKRDLGAFFKSIHETLNHILVVDKAWMGRFLRTIGQNLHCAIKGQGVIASAAKQSVPVNSDCFVTYRSSQ